MTTQVTRPAFYGQFSEVLEAVAKNKRLSTTQVLKHLMQDAWGEDLENAPIGSESQSTSLSHKMTRLTESQSTSVGHTPSLSESQSTSNCEVPSLEDLMKLSV